MHKGVDRFAIGRLAREFGVSFSWALQRRKDYIRNQLAGITETLNQINQEIERNENAFAASFVQEVCSRLRHEIKDMKSELKSLEQPERIRDESAQQLRVDQFMIERARNHPIAELLTNEVRGKMTRCFNHDDRHPSMQVNETTVYCHVCHKLWNPIDILMQVRGYSFVDAVIYLNGGVDTSHTLQREQTSTHMSYTNNEQNTQRAEKRENTRPRDGPIGRRCTSEQTGKTRGKKQKKVRGIVR